MYNYTLLCSLSVVHVMYRISGGTALKRNIHEAVSRQIQANWAKGKWKVRIYNIYTTQHDVI